MKSERGLRGWKTNFQKGGTNPIQMLNTTEIDKLSEIYDYFDHNGDGALVSYKTSVV